MVRQAFEEKICRCVQRHQLNNIAVSPPLREQGKLITLHTSCYEDDSNRDDINNCEQGSMFGNQAIALMKHYRTAQNVCSYEKGDNLEKLLLLEIGQVLKETEN